MKSPNPVAYDRFGMFYVCLAVLGAYTSQQILSPILPQLSREIGLSEIQLGTIISSGAAVIAILSPFLGRRSDNWDRKSVLVVALFGVTFGLLVFAITAQLTINQNIEVWLAFPLFIASRGLIFGACIAGVQVFAQSYIADITEGEQTRVAGISLMGACIGFGLVAGPGLGGVLAQAGLVQSLFISPALLAVIATVVWILLPRHSQRKVTQKAKSKVRFADPRIWPFLLIGSGIYLAISIFSINIGFLVRDRLPLDVLEAAKITGVILLAGGIPMLLMQGWIIPRLGWSPRTLIKAGLPIAALAFVLMALAESVPIMLLAAILSGTGHSLAIPGYTSAPTLLFSKAEQGGVAGLISSTNASAMIAGPIIATTLYHFSPSVPFIVGAIVQAALFVFAVLFFIQPTLKK